MNDYPTKNPPVAMAAVTMPTWAVFRYENKEENVLRFEAMRCLGYCCHLHDVEPIGQVLVWNEAELELMIPKDMQGNNYKFVGLVFDRLPQEIYELSGLEKDALNELAEIRKERELI